MTAPSERGLDGGSGVVEADHHHSVGSPSWSYSVGSPS